MIWVNGVRAEQYTLTVLKAGSGTGTVTSSPAGINCGSDCSEPYNQGAKITLKVKADPGSTFKGWSGGCTGTSSSCKLTMTSDQTVTATFALPDLRGEWSDLSIKESSAGYEASAKLTVYADDAKANNVKANVYLSDDEAYDSSDILLGPVTIGTINAGASKSKTYKYKGSNNPSGKCLIAVIDPDNTVKESNEDNNVVVSTVIVIPISDAKRMEVLDSVTEKIESLPGENLEAEIQEVVSLLQSFPEVEEAGVSEDSSIWARFTDQRLLIILNNREPSEETEPTFFPQSIQSVETGAGVPGLPDSSKFRLLNSLGTCFKNPNSEIAQWLTANGYTAQSNDATVEGLKKVSGDGVLFFDAHGGMGNLRGGGPDAKRYAIWTATEVNDANEKALKADLDDGSLCYVMASHDRSGGKCTKPKHYGITYKFVKKYMSFEDNSFVFIDACSSFTSTALKEAFFEKGASVYAGWTTTVMNPNATFAAKFVFDRLLGANKADPLEDPKQRPFDYVSIWQDMVARGYDDSGKGGKLMFELYSSYMDGDFFGSLAPSIAYMFVNEAAGELVINGFFGREEGKVTVGGNSVNVKRWEYNWITCDLPPELAGDVYVEVNGHKSNVVPLTVWKGQFRYTENNSIDCCLDSHQGQTQRIPYSISVICDLSFRDDIHLYRAKPHETPHTPFQQSYDLPFARAARGSKCIYEFKILADMSLTPHCHEICDTCLPNRGAYDYDGVMDYCSYQGQTANTDVKFCFEIGSAETNHTFLTNRAHFFLRTGWLIEDDCVTCHEYGRWATPCSTTYHDIPMGFHQSFDVPNPTVGNNFVIPAFSKQEQTPSWVKTYEWDEMIPSHVPDPHNTPAKFK